MVHTNEKDSQIEAPKPESKSILSSDEMQEFESMYPNIVQELIRINDEMMPEMESITDWMVRVMNYNVCGGKKLRGLMVGVAYKSLVKDPTPEDMKKAYVLGWVIEMFQGASLVADDIMDHSETRRGKLCWYKVEEVGMLAVNDCFLLEILAYRLLHIYFGSDPIYLELSNCVREIIYKSIFGQSLDCLTGRTEDIMKSFTQERYDAIVKYKTSYYTMYFPVALAMILAGKSGNKETMSKVEEVLLAVGHYFQVQDDYLDCFGDENVTGKIGTDIQDNKCTWLVVQAMERCTPEQLNFLIENYGKQDPKKVEKVKSLYRDLDMPQMYSDYELEAQKKIADIIKKLPDDVDEEIFRQLFLKIYQRRK